jgi:hypothetical protein
MRTLHGRLDTAAGSQVSAQRPARAVGRAFSVLLGATDVRAIVIRGRAASVPIQTEYP